MIIDLNRYRHVIKPILKQWVENYPDRDKFEVLETVAQMNSCPLIAVAFYLEELYGQTDKLDKYIARLIDYYQVEVINKKEKENDGSRTCG